MSWRRARYRLGYVLTEAAGVLRDIARGIAWLVAVVALAIVVYVLGALIVDGQVVLPW